MSDEREPLWSDTAIAEIIAGMASKWEAAILYSILRGKRDDYEARITELEAQLSKTWQPQPDWSSAPEWAQWWSVDADGEATFWQNKPDVIYIRGMWHDDGECLVACDLDLPIGIDWRTTLRQRPTEVDHE